MIFAVFAWYVYACKTATIAERIIADRSNAVRDSYACKSAATAERRIADRSNTVAYRYACKSAATDERRIRYYFYVRSYCYVTQAWAFFKYRIKIRACACAVFGIPYYARKSAAIIERTTTDRSNTVAYCYTCKSAAILWLFICTCRHIEREYVKPRLCGYAKSRGDIDKPLNVQGLGGTTPLAIVGDKGG